MSAPRTDWLETATGHVFAPLDAQPEFNTLDLILGLSRECRFNGQLRPEREFYSVAEHLTLLTRYAIDLGEYSEIELRTLAMHDASEGLLGDIVRPLKRMCPDFCTLEERFEQHLAERYRLIYPYPNFVKELDSRMLITERRQAMPDSGNRWHEDGLDLLPVNLQFWLPGRAAAEYSALLFDLGVE